MNLIGKDMVLRIFDYSSIATIVKCRQVSKLWYKMIKSKYDQGKTHFTVYDYLPKKDHKVILIGHCGNLLSICVKKKSNIPFLRLFCQNRKAFGFSQICQVSFMLDEQKLIIYNHPANSILNIRIAGSEIILYQLLSYLFGQEHKICIIL